MNTSLLEAPNGTSPTVDTSEPLVITQTGFERSATIGQLTAAMAKAQGAMKAAVKNAKNPHFGNRYADLSACQDSYRSEFSKNGLAVFQPVTSDGQRVMVTTLVAHTSGEWISATLTLPAEKNNAQGIGSAITYGRRYGLSLAGVVSDEDDDGNAASEKPNGQAHAEKPAKYDQWINIKMRPAAMKGFGALSKAYADTADQALKDYHFKHDRTERDELEKAAKQADATNKTKEQASA